MIVVTGMHRSGTSLVAMTLEALGVSFGNHEEFYGSDRWNERGYFERRDVIDLNSRLLTGFPRTGSRGRLSLGRLDTCSSRRWTMLLGMCLVMTERSEASLTR